MYDAGKLFYCSSNNLNLEDVQQFSPMEDKTGYNECTSDIHTDYIINVFKEFVEKYKSSMTDVTADRALCEIC